MRAVSIVPLEKDSLDLIEVPEPPEEDGPVLVQTLAIGVCGTDLELIRGEYGWAPPGRDRLVIGHESLGVVLEAPEDSGFRPGDQVVAIVRRPCDHCPNCAVGEWDMCRSGDYTEWGIKSHDGYARERYRITPEYLVKVGTVTARKDNVFDPSEQDIVEKGGTAYGLWSIKEHHGYARERYRITGDYVVKVDPALGELGVLLEPTTVVAKAWDHIERIGTRARWEPVTVLITGAGPIGLLAALLGVQRGLQVHVLDQIAAGLKPDLVAALGATYHQGTVASTGVTPDVAIECTGVGQLIFDVMDAAGSNGVVCLTGVSSARELSVDVGLLNRRMVLANDVVFGSVNANRRHYEAGAAALAQADREWLARLITRTVPLASWREAYQRLSTDVKVVLSFDSGSG